MSFTVGKHLGEERVFSRPTLPGITPALIEGSRGMGIAEVAAKITPDLAQQRRYMGELIGLAMEGDFGLSDNDRILPWSAGCVILQQPPVAETTIA